MTSINPTRDQLEHLLERLPMEQPITMLNLLRFREQADYGPESGGGRISGREAYARYAATAKQKLAEIGARIEWSGASLGTLIGPETEQWDEVFLVRYPSAQAFFNMLAMPDYQEAAQHRTAALADSRLIVTQGEVRGGTGAGG